MATDVVVYDKVDKESEKIQDALYALYPQQTITDAAIASFSDGSDGIPVKELVVAVEPQQDLHGYDSPWPEGGGKNLIKNDGQSQTINGVTFTVNSDGSITAKGTATAGISFPIWGQSSPESRLIDLKADEQYTVSGTNVQLNGTTAKSGVDVPATFTAQSGDYISFVWIYILNGTVVDKTYYPQLELGSTATAYAPYSNICPISGWTGAEIEGTGKNLWDEEWELGGIATSTGALYPSTTSIRSKYAIPVKPDTEYYIAQPSRVAGIYLYTHDMDFISYDLPGLSKFTTPSNCAFLRLGFQGSYGTTYNHDISINYPSTDTAYQAYTGSQISVTFPTSAGTVYGATLTVNPDRTGQLVVHRVMQIVNGSETWYEASTGNYKYYYCTPAVDTIAWTSDILCDTYNPNGNAYSGNRAQYDGAKQLRIIDGRMNSTADLIAYLAQNNVHVVYPLATPITYTLTATEISGILETLYGTNNIWADCGDIQKLTYRADLGKYIDSHITTAVANALNA